MPLGKAPFSWKVGTGKPEALGMKEPAWPVANVIVLLLVMALKKNWVVGLCIVGVVRGVRKAGEMSVVSERWFLRVSMFTPLFIV